MYYDSRLDYNRIDSRQQHFGLPARHLQSAAQVHQRPTISSSQVQPDYNATDWSTVQPPRKKITKRVSFDLNPKSSPSPTQMHGTRQKDRTSPPDSIIQSPRSINEQSVPSPCVPTHGPPHNGVGPPVREEIPINPRYRRQLLNAKKQLLKSTNPTPESHNALTPHTYGYYRPGTQYGHYYNRQQSIKSGNMRSNLSSGNQLSTRNGHLAPAASIKTKSKSLNNGSGKKLLDPLIASGTPIDQTKQQSTEQHTLFSPPTESASKVPKLHATAYSTGSKNISSTSLSGSVSSSTSEKSSLYLKSTPIAPTVTTVERPLSPIYISADRNIAKTTERCVSPIGVESQSMRDEIIKSDLYQSLKLRYITVLDEVCLVTSELADSIRREFKIPVLDDTSESESTEHYVQSQKQRAARVIELENELNTERRLRLAFEEDATDNKTGKKLKEAAVLGRKVVNMETQISNLLSENDLLRREVAELKRQAKESTPTKGILSCESVDGALATSATGSSQVPENGFDAKFKAVEAQRDALRGALRSLRERKDYEIQQSNSKVRQLESKLENEKRANSHSQRKPAPSSMPIVRSQSPLVTSSNGHTLGSPLGDPFILGAPRMKLRGLSPGFRSTESLMTGMRISPASSSAASVVSISPGRITDSASPISFESTYSPVQSEHPSPACTTPYIFESFEDSVSDPTRLSQDHLPSMGPKPMLNSMIPS